MDIRLIFRNRRRTDPGEVSDAKRLKRPVKGTALRVVPGVGVERVTRAGSSQVMGRRRKVASAWRWLSTSKGAGRVVGKSAAHVPQA